MEIVQIVRKFKEKVRVEFGDADVVLFGSRARGVAEKNSDIDVAVIINDNVDWSIREAIYDLAYEIGLEYDLVLDVVIYSREDWEKLAKFHPLVVNAEKEGIAI